MLRTPLLISLVAQGNFLFRVEMRCLIFIALLFILRPSIGQEIASINAHEVNSAHFNLCDENISITHHTEFSLVYNDSAEQAEWVAYKITPQSLRGEIERTNDFREDTLIREGSASLEDYSGSGYDRGHLAPAGIMKSSHEGMSESFLMSNISPQLPSFNRGVWKRLEEKIRYWSEKNDSLLIITGPILDEPIDTIGPNKVLVPSAYFKTVIAFKGDEIRGIAFLLPHESSSASLYSFATSIDHIETLKEMDFYCNLNIKALETIEKNESIKFFLFGK